MKLTKREYQQLCNQAKRFANFLLLDAGFSHPGVNRVALESMLLGWMTQWKPFLKAQATNHRNRRNLMRMAQDRALEAASDVVYTHFRFVEPANPPIICKIR